MTAFAFMLAVLAVNAGAYAIAEENITAPLRDWIQDHGWYWRPDGDEWVTPDGGVWVPKDGRGVWRWFYGLVDCPRCVGFYLTFPATLVVLGAPDSWAWWLSFWAIYGAHLALTAVLMLVKSHTKS